MANEPGWLPDPYDSTRLRWWDGERWSLHVARGRTVTTAPLEVVPAPPRRRIPVWGWLLIVLAALIVVFGIPRLGLAVALVVLVTALIALGRSTPTWLRLRSRTAAGAAVAGAAAVALVTVALIATPGPSQQQSTTGAVPLVSSDDRADTAEPESTFREETVTETIPFGASTVEDPNLPSGQSQVTTAGQAGERTLTYRVEYIDGREVDRELVSDVVTREPVTEVTAVGTYVAPPPPASEASGCDPNYADACVPVSSDVDCAWGTGDGPAYFDGVARVVGADVYDLDRDNDGYACEQ